jgi:HEAT repeat protein
MAYYDLEKPARARLAARIRTRLVAAIVKGKTLPLFIYFSDKDTYIRKVAYLAIGKIYSSRPGDRSTILHMLNVLSNDDDHLARQTAVNAAGEIGIADFSPVRDFFDRALFDVHHTVRNAVIGSVKKMGEKNPGPVLSWAAGYLRHPDKEIRREICHGIELRGRRHPEDILPLLRELQFDKTARVRNTLVHVIGQISYKKGCLEIVLEDLNHWDNTQLVAAALKEIVSVHDRYRNFAHYNHATARHYIHHAFPMMWSSTGEF